MTDDAPRPLTEDVPVVAYTEDDLAYWRKRVARTGSVDVPADTPWPDADVLLIVGRFLATLDARPSGDEALRYREALEIIAAPSTGALDAIRVEARNIARAALRESDALAPRSDVARTGRFPSSNLQDDDYEPAGPSVKGIHYEEAE